MGAEKEPSVWVTGRATQRERPWKGMVTMEENLTVVGVQSFSQVKLGNEYAHILAFGAGLYSLLRPGLLSRWAALVLGVCRQNVC